jgi:hypothetical protein
VPSRLEFGRGDEHFDSSGEDIWLSETTFNNLIEEPKQWGQQHAPVRTFTGRCRPGERRKRPKHLNAIPVAMGNGHHCGKAIPEGRLFFHKMTDHSRQEATTFRFELGRVGRTAAIFPAQPKTQP